MLVSIRIQYRTHVGTSQAQNNNSFQTPPCTHAEQGTTLRRVKEEKTRDPYNTAIATCLKTRFDTEDFGMMRLVRATGIPRASLNRYLSGERDIPVAVLRRIAAVLTYPVATVVRDAERSLKD